MRDGDDIDGDDELDEELGDEDGDADDDELDGDDSDDTDDDDTDDEDTDHDDELDGESDDTDDDDDSDDDDSDDDDSDDDDSDDEDDSDAGDDTDADDELDHDADPSVSAMAGPRVACRTCREEITPVPGTGGLCESCREIEFPPITNRHGKWSPLALGGLSLVCDVMMIPTILAISRAVSELRTVSRREAQGYWSPEHEQVRTGAVWGMLLGGLRPLVVVLLFAVVGLTSAMDQEERYAVPTDTELDEVLALLRDADPARQELGADQLFALQTDRALSDVEQLRALSTIEGMDTTPALRGAAVQGLLARRPSADPTVFADPPPWSLERLAGLYPRLDALGQGALLSSLVRQGTTSATDLFLALALGDATSDDLMGLPAGELLQRPQEARRALPPLLALPAGHRFREEARYIASLLCMRERPVSLPDAHDPLLEDWAEARRWLTSDAPPREGRWDDRAGRARGASVAVAALACVEGADVDAAVRDATELDPSVALVAARVMRRRGASIPSRLVARLAEDVLTREPIFGLLRELGQDRRIPARWRSTRALAESLVAQTNELEDPGAPMPTVTWLAQRERSVPGGSVEVEVFELVWPSEDESASPEDLEHAHVAVGPFSNGVPPPIDAALQWSEPEMDAVWSNERSVDALVDTMDAFQLAETYDDDVGSYDDEGEW